MKIITDALSGTQIGTPVSFRNLTLFPILGEGAAGGAEYLTLEEALARKEARVTEVCESGSVPELLFANEGALPIFLLDGEELIGARQNRVLNLSILVAGGRTLVIPVSCVERGRWHARSREFSSAARAQYSKGRASRMAQVTESMKHGGRQSDQQAVWHDLELKFGELAADSPTRAMSDIYDGESARLEGYVRKFLPERGQVGALFGIGGRVAGIELFCSDVMLSKLLPKLVRSYGLDALGETGEEPGGAALTVKEAARFMSRIGRARALRMPALGEGEDVRLSGRTLSGAALIKDGAVVHLSAFPAMVL